MATILVMLLLYGKDPYCSLADCLSAWVLPRVNKCDAIYPTQPAWTRPAAAAAAEVGIVPVGPEKL